MPEISALDEDRFAGPDIAAKAGQMRRRAAASGMPDVALKSVAAASDMEAPAGRRKRRRRPDAATVFGAAFGALMLAIGVNALALQRERHPAPWFEPAAEAGGKKQEAVEKKAPAPAPLAASEPTAPQAAAAAPAPVSAPPVATPPERPRETTSSLERRRKDPVGDLLKSGHTPAKAGREPSAAVAAIQRTLKKLGYAVEVDGLVGKATVAAIARFEHDHRLPVKGQLTARMFQEITAASVARKP